MAKRNDDALLTKPLPSTRGPWLVVFRASPTCLVLVYMGYLCASDQLLGPPLAENEYLPMMIKVKPKPATVPVVTPVPAVHTVAPPATAHPAAPASATHAVSPAPAVSHPSTAPPAGPSPRACAISAGSGQHRPGSAPGPRAPHRPRRPSARVKKE